MQTSWLFLLAAIASFFSGCWFCVSGVHNLRHRSDWRAAFYLSAGGFCALFAVLFFFDDWHDLMRGGMTEIERLAIVLIILAIGLILDTISKRIARAVEGPKT